MRPVKRGASLALVLVLAALGAGAASAQAAGPPQLWQTPENGAAGSAAGQLGEPHGVATDPNTGDVYVVERKNNRISVFSAWGEFVKAFGWGVADGAPELESCGPGATPPTTECRSGLAGDGAGQFDSPAGGIALDPAGNVYVGDLWGNHRVQKFSADGSFEFMLGAGVEQGPLHPGDICTAADLAEGDTCGAGVAGAAGGQFETTRRVNDTYVTTGPDGKLYVGDKGRVQIFSPVGAFEGEIPLPPSLASEYVSSLTVDPSSRIYLTTAGPCAQCGTNPNVLRLDHAGDVTLTYAVPNHPQGIALDSAGDLYVAVESERLDAREIIEFDPSGAPLIGIGEGFAKRNGPAATDALYWGIATNPVTTAGASDLYLTVGSTPGGLSTLTAFGPPPAKWPKPVNPPEITDQYALAVGTTTAELGARINPRFWEDTTYYFEYGLAPCATGGCGLHSPVPPGVGLGAGVVKAPISASPVVLSGLQPGATYHYRAVAQSAGGGPTVGVGAGHAEGTFRTAREPSGADTCPNRSFRLGAGAGLPDCRAYELVSPEDKSGGDVIALIEVSQLPAVLNQSAFDGNSFVFGSSRSYKGSDAAPFTSQYLAARGSGGWTSQSVTPPRERIVAQTGFGLDTELKALSPDLCQGWLLTFAEPTLAPGAVPNYSNLYRHYQPGPSCPAPPGYEALTTIKPRLPLGQAEKYSLELQGVSEDGATAIFLSSDNLPGTGAPAVLGSSSPHQLYEKVGDDIRYVCILPGEIPSNRSCSAGTLGATSGGNPNVQSRQSDVDHAISADGSRIFWSSSNGGEGPIYVRIDGTRTVPVSEQAEALSGTSGSQFWTASADGERAYFTTGDTDADLYEFNVDTEATTLIAGEADGVLGASDDARWIYFESEEVLSGANAEGRLPVPGNPNLYLDHEGSIRLVSPLTPADITGVSSVGSPNFSRSFGAITTLPFGRLARVNPNGHVAAFTTFANPSGYDNTDAVSGKEDAEVYLYDATANGGGGKLLCASCNPSGARPHGEDFLARYQKGGEFWAGGVIPGWQDSLYASRALADDGRRLFFISSDALAPRDTNGIQDVYEWEAVGAGDCRGSSAGFSAAADGCISLVSSGTGREKSEFLDASASGDDVFFSTLSDLVPQDSALLDIYDARVDGGLPAPSSPPQECVGEACQGAASSPPNHAEPGTAGFVGPGNLPRRHCPKGKRLVQKKGKARCVRRYKVRHHRHRRHHRALGGSHFKRHHGGHNDRRGGRHGGGQGGKA